MCTWEWEWYYGHSSVCGKGVIHTPWYSGIGYLSFHYL